MKKRNGTILALGLASLALSVAATATSLAKGAMMTKAEDTLVYTLDTTGTLTGSNNSYAGNCDITSDGVTWNFSGNSKINPWRIGGKSITKQDRTVYTKTAMPDAISKIDLEVGTASSITVNSLNLIVASNKDFSTVIETVPATFAASSTITFSPSTRTEWATGSYYKFVFNVTVSGSKNKFVEFKKVEMYKPLTASTTFSVSYDSNGGTGEVTDSSEYLSGASATVLAGDSLSKENYEFAGWNTEADGTGTAYNPGDSLVVEGDTTLYAQWNRTHYVVTYNPNGGTGDAFTEKVAVADASSYVAAANTAFTNGTYDFDGWATSVAGAVVYGVGDSVTLTDDLTLYAHWDIPAMAKIASNDDLYEGMSVIIGNANGSMVMGAQNSKNRAALATTGLVPNPDFAALTLGIEDTVDGIRYTFHDGAGYLYAASSSDNHLKVQTALDDNGRWDIDLATSKVKATGTNTHNLLRYNSSNKLFSCYETGQAAIALYALPQTITDEQIANTFIKKYMHLDSAPVGETGEGKCVTESWYASAKEAFNKLTEDQRLLVTGNADVYARLEAWAVANGDEMTGDMILDSKSAPFRSEVEAGQDKNVAIAATVCGLGLVSAASLLLLRRKKQDRE